jgi:hypothetical protein
MPASMKILDRIATDAGAWARGKNPWVRLPLLLWMAYILARHVADPDYGSLISGLNLGIHELGHFVFAAFGDFMAAAGGTLLQIIAPLVGITMFLRQRDWFAVGFALAWLGTNFFGIAPYAADARARALPLVTPGPGDPIHDWYYMLARLGWLQHDELIGRFFRMMGILTMGAAILFGAWILWRMAAGRKADARAQA